MSSLFLENLFWGFGLLMVLMLPFVIYSWLWPHSNQIAFEKLKAEVKAEKLAKKKLKQAQKDAEKIKHVAQYLREQHEKQNK